MLNLFKFLLLAADMPVPSETPMPSPSEMIPGYEGAFLKMFLALIALLVGIFFTVWILKRLAAGRWANGNGSRVIKIIEKKPLSPKTMLYVIDVDGQQAVIAESQLEVKHLMNLEEFTEEQK